MSWHRAGTGINRRPGRGLIATGGDECMMFEGKSSAPRTGWGLKTRDAEGSHMQLT